MRFVGEGGNESVGAERGSLRLHRAYRGHALVAVEKTGCAPDLSLSRQKPDDMAQPIDLSEGIVLPTSDGIITGGKGRGVVVAVGEVAGGAKPVHAGECAQLLAGPAGLRTGKASVERPAARVGAHA